MAIALPQRRPPAAWEPTPRDWRITGSHLSASTALRSPDGPVGGGGHEVLAAEDVPEQELREHVRLQRELAAVGGQGTDLAHHLSGHVTGQDAPAGVPGR